LPTEEAISACEAEIDCRLPEQYREFVLRDGLNDLRFRNAVLSPDEIPAIRNTVSAGLIPFASNGCGDFYCWYEPGIDPPVVFWSHEDGTVMPAAESFLTWLAANRF
jgi:hypothetical protein